MTSLRAISRSLGCLKLWNTRIQNPITQSLPPATCNRPATHSLLSHNTLHFRAASTTQDESKITQELSGEEFQDVDIDNEDLPTGTNFKASVDTGDTSWGPIALRCTENILLNPQLQQLSLFSFKVMASNRKIAIRLDKLSNKYGSPSLEEIQEFSGVLAKALEAEMGEMEAGSIEVEVSSPGAEREVKVPIELERFKEFPMQVVFNSGDEVEKTKVLNFFSCKDEIDVGLVTEWRLADTKAGRELRKGRPLKKKDRELVIEIPVHNLKQVNLYLDA